jgi:hypothetical protein
MESKVCIICKDEKFLIEYYAHPKMSDGRLNKCKTCCRSQSLERYKLLAKDDEWILKERERSKEKYHRLGYLEKQKEICKKYEWRASNKYKGLRKWYERRFGVLDPMIELHHWSYKDENMRDIILLNRGLHRKIHSQLELVYSEKCYKTKDGVLLDSKQKHLEFIKFNFMNTTI